MKKECVGLEEGDVQYQRCCAELGDGEYAEMLRKAGLRQGLLSACVLYREQKNICTVAHGDDFTVP